MTIPVANTSRFARTLNLFMLWVSAVFLMITCLAISLGAITLGSVSLLVLAGLLWIYEMARFHNGNWERTVAMVLVGPLLQVTAWLLAHNLCTTADQFWFCVGLSLALLLFCAWLITGSTERLCIYNFGEE